MNWGRYVVPKRRLSSRPDVRFVIRPLDLGQMPGTEILFSTPEMLA